MNENKKIMVEYIQKVENGKVEFDEALNILSELSENNGELYTLAKEYEKGGVEAMIHNGVLTLEEYAQMCGVDGQFQKHEGENDYSIWVSENYDDLDSGHSVRGTLEEILEEINDLK